MPSKKSANQHESVDRLHDLLSQLKSARRTAGLLTDMAKREVGDAMVHSGLLPMEPSARPRRVRKKQKKR